MRLGGMVRRLTASPLRRAVIAFLTGALMVSSAWAGASLVPVSTGDSGDSADAPVAAQAEGAAAPAKPPPGGGGGSDPGAVPDPASLPEGQVLAGAAKTSIFPRPEDYDGTWETSREKCATLSAEGFQAMLREPVEAGDHLASTGSPWPENPNCIYMGGFGLGPMNPVTSWNEEVGLWVRAIAMRDREGDDLVLAVIDGEGYFWDYESKCDDCGIKQLTAQLAADAELGLEAKDIVIAATHGHSAPDFIGGWGFVPDWYMKQVADTIKSTVRDAVASMRPAVLEHGEQTARPFNRERRDTYRSAEEQQLAWLRAYAPGQTGGGGGKKPPPAAGETIATLGAYAAHPTTFGTNDGEAHPDWPGLFEKSLEERFGGVGLHFMTGLGNMSAAGLEHSNDPAHQTGADDLAGLISATGAGNPIEQPDIRTTRTTWLQPTTNLPLTALGGAGFFDRKFSGPANVQTGKNPEKFQCTSSAPVSAEVAASAARIGPELALTAAPGEIFSNFSNTLKEQSNAPVTLPLGQANDALGYMPQSFEMSPIGQQGLGFVGELQGFLFVNYEDAYSIDRCFGDMALETSIDLLNALPPG
jgi:hypothetical protein